MASPAHAGSDQPKKLARFFNGEMFAPVLDQPVASTADLADYSVFSGIS
jgi:hypothetical protein